MSFSLVPLLLHRNDVPVRAQQALRAATSASDDERTPYLESAARILHHELHLDCADARELVGLRSPGTCH